MADLQKTIELLFQGDDQASSVIRSVSGHLDDFGSKVSGLNQATADITSPFSDLAGMALKTEAAIAAAGAAMVTMAVNQAGQFSDSFAEISTLVTTSDENLGKFKDELLGYSRDSSFAFEEINEAVYQAISFGADYTQALDAVATAEKLAIGGKAGLASATELLSGTLNAYGADVSEAGRYSDIFFTIVKDGKTTIPELASNLSKVTGIAAAAGVPMDTLGSAIAAITASGAPTSEAITGLKAVISNIIKPTKDASETAELLGLKFNATALETKGLDGLLAEIYKTTGGNVEQMGKLFGSTEALNAALILGADSSGTFSRALADMEKATGATDAAYKKMADNIALANQNAINNALATMIEFGTPLLGSYRELADGIVAIFKGISISIGDGAFDPVFDELNAQAARAAEFLQAMADALPAAMKNVDLKGLLESSRDLGKSISNLIDGVDLTSASGLAKAIQEVVDSVEGLTRFTSGIVEGAGPVIRTLIDWAQGFNDLDDSTQNSAGQLTGFLAIINQLTGPLDAVMGSIGGLTTAFSLMAGSSLLNAATGGAGLGNLVANIGKLGPALAAIAGPGLVAGSVLTATGLAVSGLYDEMVGYEKALEEVRGSEERGVASTEALTQKFKDISAATGVTVTNNKELSDQIKKGNIRFDEATRAYSNGSTTLNDYIQKVRDATDTSGEWYGINNDIISGLGGLDASVDSVTISLDKNGQAAIDTAAAYYEWQGNTPKIAKTMALLESGSNKTAKAMENTGKKTEEVQKQLNQLASDERIKAMEFTADLKVAGIEAITKQVEAAFSSIDNTINSTGDLLGGLFTQLNDTSYFSGKYSDIQNQIEKENAIRLSTAEQGRRLTELQIKILEQKAEAMAKGEGLIKIDTTGVEPAIAMVLWEILKKVQIQAAETEQSFLLGV